MAGRSGTRYIVRVMDSLPEKAMTIVVIGRGLTITRARGDEMSHAFVVSLDPR